MYVLAQICYQHVILPNFEVLMISVAAMDQKLHFLPPGYNFYICYVRSLNSMQFYPCFNHLSRYYGSKVDKMVSRDHALSVSTVQYITFAVHYVTVYYITVHYITVQYCTLQDSIVHYCKC